MVAAIFFGEAETTVPGSGSAISVSSECGLGLLQNDCNIAGKLDAEKYQPVMTIAEISNLSYHHHGELMLTATKIVYICIQFIDILYSWGFATEKGTYPILLFRWLYLSVVYHHRHNSCSHVPINFQAWISTK